MTKRQESRGVKNKGPFLAEEIDAVVGRFLELAR